MTTRRNKKKSSDKARITQREDWLEELYLIGEAVHRELNNPRMKNGAVCVKIAKEFKVNRTIVDEARNVVGCYKNKKDFDRLCRVRVKGLPLSRKHIFALARVTDLTQRRALEKEVANKELSVPQLIQAIRRRIGPKRYSTDRRRRPKDLEEALLHTADLAHQWVRWYDDLLESDDVKMTPSRRKVWNRLISEVASYTDDLLGLRDAADAYLRNANAAAFVKKARLKKRTKSKSTK